MHCAAMYMSEGESRDNKIAILATSPGIDKDSSAVLIEHFAQGVYENLSLICNS